MFKKNNALNIPLNSDNKMSDVESFRKRELELIGKIGELIGKQNFYQGLHDTGLFSVKVLGHEKHLLQPKIDNIQKQLSSLQQDLQKIKNSAQPQPQLQYTSGGNYGSVNKNK